MNCCTKKGEKLSELDAKIRSIRGLKDERIALGGSSKSSQLLELSHDSHVTSMNESHDGEEDGKNWGWGWGEVTISVRLPDRSVRRKLRTTQKVKVHVRCQISAYSQCFIVCLPKLFTYKQHTNSGTSLFGHSGDYKFVLIRGASSFQE